jgi:transcriptional regulator with XRE-family HTH domain
MDIRLRLKEWREKRGLTQWELAERSGVGYATIARLEVSPGNPTLGVIYRLAEALDMDPRNLLSDPEKRPFKGRKSSRKTKQKRRGGHGGIR